MNNNMKLRWNYYLCNKLVRQHSYEHFEHFLILLCGRKPFDLKKRMNSTSPVWGKYLQQV